ncbi:thioredoxin domain-containing protein [Streptacidiphilus cavernicola]|uniref:Thioredoxin domain-containing protein n=1 Tax=Streptacidiphilus cavernicola TaxID=3342716 RepID=A0ABV6VXG0_9ACTN
MPTKKTNSKKTNSSSARDRVAAARERERRTATRRRNAVIALTAAVVVAAGVGGSIALADGGSSAKATAPSAAVTVPANTSGPGGTVIVYGKADAPNTLDVYEDFRCPICDKLERTDGATIRQLADDGTYKIQYHMGTFLDDNLGGSGSVTALAAAGAALNESPAKYEAFRTVLYANQPDEQNDGFANTDTLLALASKVPGLRNAAFDAAVRNGTYKPWAEKVGAAFSSSGVTGTPTVLLNGTTLTLFDNSGNPVSPAQFEALVRQTAAAKK